MDHRLCTILVYEEYYDDLRICHTDWASAPSSSQIPSLRLFVLGLSRRRCMRERFVIGWRDLANVSVISLRFESVLRLCRRVMLGSRRVLSVDRVDGGLMVRNRHRLPLRIGSHRSRCSIYALIEARLVPSKSAGRDCTLARAKVEGRCRLCKIRCADGSVKGFAVCVDAWSCHLQTWTLRQDLLVAR